MAANGIPPGRPLEINLQHLFIHSFNKPNISYVTGIVLGAESFTIQYEKNNSVLIGPLFIIMYNPIEGSLIICFNSHLCLDIYVIPRSPLPRGKQC